MTDGKTDRPKAAAEVQQIRKRENQNTTAQPPGTLEPYPPTIRSSNPPFDDRAPSSIHTESKNL